jgi:glucose/arabinose dehydrogenase
MELVLPFGYPDVSPLLDHQESGLSNPDMYRSTLLFGVFPSQSGAAKLDFIPGTGPFKQMRDQVIVALSGDRSPFATSGKPLTGPIGFKIVRVDIDPSKRQPYEFVRNTAGKPASMIGGNVVGLERPCDVKFAPDGTLYILDMGKVAYVNGKERVSRGTGRLFKLVPTSWKNASDSAPATAPTTRPAP